MSHPVNEVSSYGAAGSSHCETGQHGQEILRYDPTGQGVGEVTAYAGVVSPRETVQGFTVDSSVPSFPTTAGRDPRPEKLGVSSERKWRHSCSQETTGIWFPVTFLSRENFLSRGGKK